MADHKRTLREIEREVEQERAELRGTVEELLDRFSFDDVWRRAGAYMRDNRAELGHSVGQMVRDKPLAVALTAVGVGWLLFGPSQGAVRPGARRFVVRRQGRDDHGGDDHERKRQMLEEADFAARAARGPAGPRAEADPWMAPSRTSSQPVPGTAQTARPESRAPGSGAPLPAGLPGAARPAAPGPAIPANGATGNALRGIARDGGQGFRTSAGDEAPGKPVS